MGRNLDRMKMIAAFGAVFIIWGSTYLAIRYAIETIPPLMMAGIRNLLAGVPLFLWSFLTEKSRPPAAEWGRNALLGALLFVGGHGALAWSEQHLPSGLAALILTTIPLWMAVLDAWRPGGARLTPRVVAGLLVGFSGVALLTGPAELLGGAPVDPLAAMVLMCGAISWSFGSVLARGRAARSSALQATAMRLLSGGSFLLVASLCGGEWGRLDPGAVTLRSMLSLGYLIVFGSIVTFTAYTWLLHHTTPARVGTYAYVNPLVALLLGWGIGHEPMNLRILAAGVLVLASVAIVLTRARRRDRGAISPIAPPAVAGAPRVSLKEDPT